jgi:hypothetical protein
MTMGLQYYFEVFLNAKVGNLFSLARAIMGCYAFSRRLDKLCDAYFLRNPGELEFPSIVMKSFICLNETHSIGIVVMGFHKNVHTPTYTTCSAGDTMQLRPLVLFAARPRIASDFD